MPGYGTGNLLLFAIANGHVNLANQILDCKADRQPERDLQTIGRVKVKGIQINRLGRTLSLWTRADAHHLALMTGRQELAARIRGMLKGEEVRQDEVIMEAKFDNNDSR